jgi:hypothetical protein
MLIARAAALIAAMYAFLFSRIAMNQNSRPHIYYEPLSLMDEERRQNLDRIYNCNDIECIAMLRMRRAPFLGYATCLR